MIALTIVLYGYVRFNFFTLHNCGGLRIALVTIVENRIKIVTRVEINGHADVTKPDHYKRSNKECARKTL